MRAGRLGPAHDLWHDTPEQFAAALEDEFGASVRADVDACGFRSFFGEDLVRALGQFGDEESSDAVGQAP